LTAGRRGAIFQIVHIASRILRYETKMISRRSLIQAIGAAAVATRAGAQAARRRPNLLYLFSDQHAYDMMGCSGNRQIQTPVMDHLSAEGVHFDHCFSTSPVCSPYRAMVLSGMHPLRNGVFCNDVMLIPGKGKYFGEALRDAGYRTAYFGKWHLLGGNRVRPIPRGELRYGFDGPFLSNNCTTAFDATHAYYWNEKGERTLYGEWEPYAQSRQARAFLDEQRHDRPFAMFLSWHPPHDHGKRDEYYVYDTLPELMALYAKCDPELRPAVAQLDASERRKQQCRAYMAQTTGIDRALGMVLDKLKEKGLDRDTIVVYTTDHGDCLGAYGWHSSAKDIPHDCSSRVPFLLRYPGVLKPRRSDLMLGPLDLMPTLLGLMGIEAPENCQGRNLAKAITTADDRATDAVPMLMFHPGPEEYRGVITRDWTFAAQRSDKEFHPLMNVLHDRREDPDQVRNLFRDNRRMRHQMMELTRSWMNRFQDPFVSYRELRASDIEWRYPETGGTINRTSPLEWVKQTNLQAAKFHGE
jgi:arylsulfatase A-like enzyme